MIYNIIAIIQTVINAIIFNKIYTENKIKVFNEEFKN